MKYVQKRFRGLLVLFVAVGLAAAVVSGFTGKDEDDYYYKLNKGLETFGQVYREITNSYVEEVDPQEFITAGIQGMLKTLDPYTVYLRKREAADIDLLTTGSYGGIGITVGMRDSMVMIVDVIDGYSAQRAGVRIGDRILSIDGMNLLYGPLDTLREYTRGEPNTSLQFSVLRDGVDQPLHFVLTRENIKVKSVSYSGMLSNGIGYIRLERFSTNAGDETRTAIIELNKQTALRGLVLDLRGNPGGLLEAAVDVVSKFVPSGSVIVTTRGRDSSETRIYRSTEEPMLRDVPLVVLVDGGSASASEIVAGAIQDLDAGVILGTQSYGKGLVQSIRRLPYEATLKMTTARYYTPSGRCIQKIDYARRRHGIVSAIADSIRIVFRTSVGRTVHEGGGIIPDTVVTMPDTVAIVVQLRTASTLFKFGTRYSANLASIPVDFSVDEKLLRQFEAYSFENAPAPVLNGPLATRLDELEHLARREKYGQEIIRKIASLRTDLGQQQHSDFTRHREDIRTALYNEIKGRFNGQRQRLEASLTDDQQVQAAIALLRSGHGSYTRFLSVR